MGHAAVVDDQHVLVVGVSGVLGGVEGSGDYDLAVYDEEFVMKIIEVLVPADVDTAVLEDTVAAPGAVLAPLHHPLNLNSGQAPFQQSRGDRFQSEGEGSEMDALLRPPDQFDQSLCTGVLGGEVGLHHHPADRYPGVEGRPGRALPELPAPHLEKFVFIVGRHPGRRDDDHIIIVPIASGLPGVIGSGPGDKAVDDHELIMHEVGGGKVGSEGNSAPDEMRLGKFRAGGGVIHNYPDINPASLGPEEGPGDFFLGKTVKCRPDPFLGVVDQGDHTINHRIPRGEVNPAPGGQPLVPDLRRGRPAGNKKDQENIYPVFIHNQYLLLYIYKSSYFLV